VTDRIHFIVSQTKDCIPMQQQSMNLSSTKPSDTVVPEMGTKRFILTARAEFYPNVETK